LEVDRTHAVDSLSLDDILAVGFIMMFKKTTFRLSAVPVMFR
jgi:hypothetical protein